MKQKVKVIMEFNANGTTRIATIKGLPGVQKCKKVVQQLAKLNGKVDDSSFRTTPDAYVSPAQAKKDIEQSH